MQPTFCFVILVVLTVCLLDFHNCSDSVEACSSEECFEQNEVPALAECCEVQIHSPMETYYMNRNFPSLQATFVSCCEFVDASQVSLLALLDGEPLNVDLPIKKRDVYHPNVFDGVPDLVGRHTFTLQVVLPQSQVVGSQDILFETSHSQLGQDLWVLSQFPNTYKIEKLEGRSQVRLLQSGFFLDVGAYDAQVMSNTHLLEDFGWEGICVEPFPSPGTFEERQRALRGRHVLVTQAVEGEARQGVTYRIGQTEGHGNRSAGGGLEDYQKNDNEGTTAVQVDSTTLSEILDAKVADPIGGGKGGDDEQQFSNARCLIHFMSLDTEGSELSILTTFPFDRYPVALIAMEANNPEVTEPAHALLLRRGFDFVQSVQHDRYYVHTGVRALLSRTADSPAGGLLACRLREAVEGETE